MNKVRLVICEHSKMRVSSNLKQQPEIIGLDVLFTVDTSERDGELIVKEFLLKTFFRQHSQIL